MNEINLISIQFDMILLEFKNITYNYKNHFIKNKYICKKRNNQAIASTDCSLILKFFPLFVVRIVRSDQWKHSVSIWTNKFHIQHFSNYYKICLQFTSLNNDCKILFINHLRVTFNCPNAACFDLSQGWS